MAPFPEEPARFLGSLCDTCGRVVLPTIYRALSVLDMDGFRDSVLECHERRGAGIQGDEWAAGSTGP